MPKSQIDATKLNRSITLDARPDRLDLRDRIYQPPLKPIEPEFPTLAQVKEYFPTYGNRVLDQGSVGACTGFGLAAVINYQYWFRDVVTGDKERRARAKEPLVSTRMLYELAKLYDEWDGEDYEGSSCRGAMRGWHRHGVCTEKLWPYKNGRFERPQDGWEVDAVKRPLGAYYRIETKSIADVQAAIQEIHAIYVSVSIHSGWDVTMVKKGLALPEINYSSSVKPWGGHAFALVGYNQRGFIVQNSWGTDWGNQGFAVLKYEDWLDNSQDAWAAVYGAPLSAGPGTTTPVARARQGLMVRARSGGGSVFSSPDKLPKSGLWPVAQAYEHTMVLGNEGRPMRDLLPVKDGADHVKVVAEENISNWCHAKPANRKVVIFAHGGLNDETASIDRIRRLGPNFLNNGIYPLFITWKTGVLETLGNIFSDAFADDSEIVMRDLAGGIGDLWDDITDKIADANDYTWEAIARRVAGKSIWTEIKENAGAAATRGGGLYLLARHMVNLKKSFKDIEFHLAGHSAGSLVFGHLLSELRSVKFKKVHSMHLLAPACTMAFATRHFGRALDAKLITRPSVHISNLSEENERNDQVAKLYRKSLLYLVSRALEKSHKTPLLGLEAAWNPAKYKSDTFPKDEENPEIKAWLKVWGNGPRPDNWAEPQVPVRIDSKTKTIREAASHGSFDNNITVMTRTMKSILGKQRLPVPITDLTGF